MITYRLIKRLLDRVIYEYYPDGDESAPGVVEFCADGTRRVLTSSSKDFKNIFGGQALARINTSMDSGTIAMW